MWFQKKSYEVICVGSTSQDIFFPTDDGLILDTPEDITAQVKVAFELGGKYRIKDRFEAVGGVAANVAQGLARLGVPVACYSRVGNDSIGEWALQELEREHVATNLIVVDHEAKTDLSLILVMTQNGERTIFHNRDANERLTIEEEKLKGAKWLFVSALNGDWKNNLSKLLDVKKKSGLLLALNPGQHNIREDARLMSETLQETDVLLLNKDEAIELLLHSSLQLNQEDLQNELFLLEKLHALGAKVIGMTDGKRGAWGYDGKEYWQCPIHTRGSVVDSTGAGDAFGSGFFASWMKDQSLSVALKYGIANSGSVVGFYGANAGLLQEKEMEDILPKITSEHLRA